MISDLRLTLRTMQKSPGFVLVAVFTLALGIGVNAAMFGIVNAILIRGLPYAEPWRLVAVGSRNLPDNISQMGLSHADFADLRAQQRSAEELAAYDGATFNLSNPGQDPERVYGCRITVSGPAVLRATTVQGRWFVAGEDQPGAAPVVVIGHALWKNRYKSDPGIVGQPVRIDGEWATVVGVAAPNFHFPQVADAWMPLRIKIDAPRDDRGIQGLARLKGSVTVEEARAEFNGLMQRLAAAHRDTNKNVDALVRPLHDAFVDDTTRQLVNIMFGAVLLVLLIACANIANLLLARAAVRQREIAIRSALGASRFLVVRLLLMESLLLALGGGLVGVPLARGLLSLLNDYLKVRTIPFWMVFDLDWVGLAFIAGAAVFTSVVAGLWPAWQATRTDLNTVLKDSGRGSTGFSLSKFSRLLVIFEVMLSTVLLVLAGLTVRTVIKIQSAPLGFGTAGIFTCRLAMTGEAYDRSTQQRQFYRELVDRLSARSEVSGAAISDIAPTYNNRNQVEIEGRPRGGPTGSGLPPQFASRAAVSGQYFDVLGIKLAQGRLFDDRDTAESARVAVVSTRFAERNWPGENALGRHIVYGLGLDVRPEQWLTIVGVVAPTFQGQFDSDPLEIPQTYVPYTQSDDVRYVTLFTKARAGDAAALATTVRKTVLELNADLPIFRPQTMEEMVGQAKFFKILFAWIFGIFGVVALVLAAVGLYGVMSYSVSQRTQEIGVRMALGAEPRDVLALILREGGGRLAVGLVLGLAGAFFAGRILAFVLWGVEPTDAVAFGGTVGALGLTGLIACLVPASRAVRVNPVEALRTD